MTIFHVISLFGGLSLFLYGMQIMGDGLKKGASGTFKTAMEKVTNNPVMGFLMGLLVTAIIQSSTATIVIVSGLVGAGVITLHQSLGIILGANVGTTITAQIIRLLDIGDGASFLQFFKPSTLAPLAAIAGILLIMAFKFNNSDLYGSIAIGFAILFTGLLNMTAAVSPLSESQTFANLFVKLSEVPVLGFLGGAAAALLIQSSSATIGILQALTVTGRLTLSSVYAIILGIYLGDCVTTAIVCSIGAKADAKRTGLVHIIFNLSGTVLVLVVITALHLSGVLDPVWDKVISSGGIANTHTMFKLGSAITLLPVCGLFERMAKRIVKDDPPTPENAAEVLLEGLDKAFYRSPALALDASRKVISEMARLAHTAVDRGLSVMENYDKATVALMDADENELDTLCDAAGRYMVDLTPHVANEHDNDLLNYYIRCVNEFERIGDLAVNLAENSEELSRRDLRFSDEARAEIAILRDALDLVISRAANAFIRTDVALARSVEPIEEVVDDLKETLVDNHLQRIRDGKCSVYSGYIFLDMLANCERISDQCSNIGSLTVHLLDPKVGSREHDYISYLHSGSDEEFNREYAALHKEYFDRLNAVMQESSEIPIPSSDLSGSQAAAGTL